MRNTPPRRYPQYNHSLHNENPRGPDSALAAGKDRKGRRAGPAASQRQIRATFPATRPTFSTPFPGVSSNGVYAGFGVNLMRSVDRPEPRRQRNAKSSGWFPAFDELGLKAKQIALPKTPTTKTPEERCASNPAFRGKIKVTPKST
jgi:hypothetical protein